MSYEMNTTELIEFLLTAGREEIQDIIEDIHPVDILDAIREYDGSKKELLSGVPDEVIAAVIDEAEDDEKNELLSIFSDQEQIKIINEMSSDELVDLIGTVPRERAYRILTSIDKEDIEEVRDLLSYRPDSAGGIMTTEFISINEEMTVGETLKYLQGEAPDAETAYYIYVLDNIGILKGVVSLRDIVISSFDVKIADIVNENVISVPFDMDQEEVGHIFEKYGFLTMPVVDIDDRMLGIITVDDIMEILRDESTEDIFRLAGVQEGERITGNVASSVKSRLPWLFVNLVTAILASSTVSLFEGTIQRVVALATFMPIVAGMGGNAGTQTLTIIVRGIALGELTFENARRILFREIGVGISNGIAIGLTVSLLGLIWEKNMVFGFIIGSAMFLNMLAATVAGYTIPIILKKLNIDPALASAVFVTTVTDVLGFFFFLGLATVLISYII